MAIIVLGVYAAIVVFAGPPLVMLTRMPTALLSLQQPLLISLIVIDIGLGAVATSFVLKMRGRRS